jgi:hypothetical protein
MDYYEGGISLKTNKLERFSIVKPMEMMIVIGGDQHFLRCTSKNKPALSWMTPSIHKEKSL